MASEAAVTFLLEQVKEVIVTYADLISSAEQEFKLLNKDLEELRAILKNMANSSSDDEVFKLTEKKLRDVVYEVEDTIDSWLTQAAAATGKRRGIGRTLAKIAPNRVDLAKQVKALRQDKVKLMLAKAEKLRSTQGPGGGASKEGQSTLNKDQSFRQENVVGFDGEEETIIGHLTGSKEGLDTISIIGMPGLGKSTLAWKIFHNQKLGYDFPIRIWVHVSRRFNFRDVCLKIMKKFTGGKDMSSMTDEELSNAVYTCLKEEKFLIVMDDVWEPEDWQAIRNVLPDSNKKGKVLITSRHEKVGNYAKKFTDPHNLKFLDAEESWQLLQLEVFGNLESCPPGLKNVGRSIAEECGGVPLTLVVMGGILKVKLSNDKAVELVESEWMDMITQVNPSSTANQEDVILDIVKLSYEGLPYDLREPFLYLGVFPDDFEIPTWTLTRLWIAEGFIQAKGKKSLEEIAEENLDELISRKLLIVMKRNPMGRVRVCRVHDMIRTFCQIKASQQDLFKEIKMSDEGVEDNLASSVEDVHRLCLHSNIPRFFEKKVKGPRVRSFLCFQKESFLLNPTYISAIPESFELLRILHSKPIRLDQFPPKITNLNHLRYIILCFDNDQKILPPSISQLWNLQTIVVDTKSRTLTCNANIWKMIRLRHFKTKAAIILDTNFQGEAGKNLQTLSRLSVPDSGITNILKKAYNLKTLGVRGNLDTLFKDMSWEKLASLENLKLEYDLEYESPSENPLQRFPQGDGFPKSLKRVTLSNTYLSWSHMTKLAAISNLEVLKLKQNAFTGFDWQAKNQVFSTLQYLLIVDADLVVWEASDKTFPRLRCLMLKSCETLKAIPDCVVKHLDTLNVDRVRKSIIDFASEIGVAKKREEELNKGKWGARFNLSIGAASDLAQK